MELFALCVKIVSIDKLLADKEKVEKTVAPAESKAEA
jgi:hypothetical protein